MKDLRHKPIVSQLLQSPKTFVKRISHRPYSNFHFTYFQQKKRARPLYGLCFFILILSAIQCMDAFADTTTEIGRYLTVDNKPKSAQIDLLSQIIQVRFPQSVQTIGDAMNYVLRLSGYSLVSLDRMNNSLKTTLSKSLPAVDRDFGPMSLKDALTTLAGQAFYLVQDPLNRLVDFRVKPQFIKLYAASTKTHHVK